MTDQSTKPDLRSRILSVLASARALTVTELCGHVSEADPRKVAVALIDLRREGRVVCVDSNSGWTHWSRPDVGRPA